MPTLSLGTGLVNKITKNVFQRGAYVNIRTGAQYVGMGGYGQATITTYYYNGSVLWTNQGGRPSYFSLMKGTVPSGIADVSGNQRTSDVIVTFNGPSVSSYAQGVGTAQPTSGVSDQTINTNSDGMVDPGSATYNQNDFDIVVDGKTATWRALNLSFTPRYPTSTGTPTWFWFRSYGGEHHIIGTVGASGSGSDLELQTYGVISSGQEYTLYNATMSVFEMTQEINY